MKIAILTLASALALAAQSPVRPLPPVELPALPGLGLITVTIADQGPDAIGFVTGAKVPTARLLEATACNETDADQVLDNSMLYQRVDARSAQGITLYDSRLVVLVLAVLQDKNVFAKLGKGGQAASTIAAIIETAFKINPIIAAASLVAPAIFGAVLPVIHSPVDLTALSSQILLQNTSIKLAGRSCYSGLVIGRVTAAVTTEVITVL